MNKMPGFHAVTSLARPTRIYRVSASGSRSAISPSMAPQALSVMPQLMRECYILEIGTCRNPWHCSELDDMCNRIGGGMESNRGGGATCTVLVC